MRETSPIEKQAITRTIIGFLNLGAALLLTVGTDSISIFLMAINFIAFGWTLTYWETTFRVFFIKEELK